MISVSIFSGISYNLQMMTIIFLRDSEGKIRPRMMERALEAARNKFGNKITTKLRDSNKPHVSMNKSRRLVRE